MNRSRVIGVITHLAEMLRSKGSWCGETHLQKAVYFLQELLGVPTGFEFILYKHGPFSFDLRDELMAMRAEGFLALRVREEPYGPSLIPTKRSARLRDRYPKTLHQFRKQIHFVAEQLGGKGASELERLATALYVTLKHPNESTQNRADALKQVKVHLSPAQAKSAVRSVEELVRAAKGLTAA